jgi:DNA-directed RNA polymerase specialized sigma24 family protein
MRWCSLFGGVGEKVIVGITAWETPTGSQGEQDGETVLANPVAPADHPPSDAIRSWLARGIHTFAVDPRRRLGNHGGARRLLAADRASVNTAPGAWRELVSALQRHTMHSGLAQLSAEERQVITLAYLEGRTNRQIAAMLGVSVSTVRRRLWAGLGRLDEYVRRTGTWISAALLWGLAYVIGRTARQGRLANAVSSADWPHRLAATLAAGSMTVAAVSLVAASPDTPTSKHFSRPAPARLQLFPPATASLALTVPAKEEPPAAPPKPLPVLLSTTPLRTAPRDGDAKAHERADAERAAEHADQRADADKAGEHADQFKHVPPGADPQSH